MKILFAIQKIDGKVVNNIEIFHNGNRPSGSYKLSDYTTPAEYAHLAYGSCQGKDCYTYDASGNETSNLPDGVYYSHFNRMNLPDSVLFDKTGNTTRMSYMADGKRIRTVHKTYSTGLSYLLDNVQKFDDPIHTTEEIRDGDILFKDGIITRIDLPCGYINVREPEYDRMTAYYFVTDHLGSVRTTAAAISGKVVQQLEYTPGGTIWRSFDQNALQPKHFCTKEQLTVHGYNMYDSGKRFHTSNGIRFISMDPLAEKYYSWSPYVYCFDNPIKYLDPDGKQPRPIRPPVRRGYRNGGRPNPYAFYPRGVKSQSYMQTTNLSYTGNGLRGTMAMEPQSFLLTVNTAGGNRVQMSKDKDNSIAHFATGVAEFTDAHIDFKNKLASLVSIVKYGENGVIQNSTELVINVPDLAIQQLSYEAQATEMNENLGELDFTGKSLEKMVEMSAERKTIIQKKLGLSPKDLIMIELFTNPNAFQSTQQERRFLPEFNQR